MQEKILSNAFELFKSQGYEKTTISQIAKKSNISVGGIYKYFKTKEEIYLLYLDNEINEIVLKIQKSDKKGIYKLKEIFLYNMAFIKSNHLLNPIFLEKIYNLNAFNNLLNEISKILYSLNLKSSKQNSLNFYFLSLGYIIRFINEDYNLEKINKKISSMINFYLRAVKKSEKTD